MTTNTVRGTGRRIQLTAEQLVPRDAVFVYDEFERHPANIVAAYVFSGSAEITRAQVRTWMRERLGYSALFHRRLERVPGDIDLPYWVPDAAFDLDEHVTFEEARTWGPVRVRLAEIAATRMDLTRPPWELHVFAGVSGFPDVPEPVTIVVLKFHHSVGDGVATRRLEQKLFGAGADHPPLPVVDHSWSPSAALLRAATLTPYRIGRFVIGLTRTRAAARTVSARVADGLVHEPIPMRPATRFNRRTTAAPTFGLVTLSLAEVRAVKGACAEPITVNDVLLAVVSGALATYLAECDETPPTSLSAMVPISMRGLAPWNSANRLCQMAVDLHTDVDDPVQRLRAVHRSARQEKQRWSDDAVIARESRLHTAPAWLLRLAGWARSQRNFDDVDTVPLTNTTVSNVAPVAERLEFLGAPIRSVFGVLPIMDGDGLRHLITSQGDRLVVAFSSETAMLPDSDRYAELLLRSFRELSERLRRAG